MSDPAAPGKTGTRQVLLLGAGLVSQPLVEHFMRRDDTEVVVGSLYLEDAEKLIGGRPGARPLAIDVTSDEALAGPIAAADVVVSLVPYALHPRIARVCIDQRKPLVTASYVSPEMRALDGPARDAGIPLMNEIGLDPGLDHISALKLIHDVQRSGGTVTTFDSCAGGLPAPEAADNPWRYKFSWSPRGVLLAGTNASRFLRDGEIIEQQPLDVFGAAAPYEVEGLGTFESYANRDAVKYIEAYRLDGIRSMRRGTIRYPGWSESMQALIRLGLLDDEPTDVAAGTTWAAWTSRAVGGDATSAADRLAGFLEVADDGAVIERLRFAGLLDDEVMPGGSASSLDRVAGRLNERLALEPGERDLVILRHELTAEWPDRPRERRVSLLVEHGEPHGATAMARTVSLPSAAAAEEILDGAMSETGVVVPTDGDLGDRILARLAGTGIRFREWSQRC